MIRLTVFALVVSGIVCAPPAQAESCASHLAKHNTTASADIAEHDAGIHSGVSPCKNINQEDNRKAAEENKKEDIATDDTRNNDSSDSNYDDSDNWGDSWGWGCTWHGCG